jgi:hypothetical protein
MVDVDGSALVEGSLEPAVAPVLDAGAELAASSPPHPVRAAKTPTIP